MNIPISQSRFSAALAPAWIALIYCAMALAPAYAGPGHDHGNEGSGAVNSNAPRRLPDGSVFLPKPAQRQLGVRTVPVEAGDLPRVYELSGKVVMDPNAGGRVQPMVAGRIDAGPRGLPSIGQAVRKGDVLAYVVPTTGTLERSNQAAQLAELRAASSLAQKRVARLTVLSDTVPRKEIEIAESEVASLAARISVIGAGLAAREALLAPVSGVIASAHVVSGQVVDARELLFEVVDTSRLRIEALAYDAALAGNIGAASLAIGDERIALRYIGTARSLREQALPMQFAAQNMALSKLAVGQPVRVYVHSAATVPGLRVAAAALMKNPANQNIVWVKTAPERFEPRVVTIASLDGVSVAVLTGLKPGDRVVGAAATLINQIR